MRRDGMLQNVISGKHLNRALSCFVAGTLTWSMAGSVAMADQFHYSNLLQGSRAQGLGGAFTAVADDASGIVYNPAGLAFALSNDISGSANAFYSRKAVYKGVIGGEDFNEESGGSVPTFFGVLQKLDRWVPGLVGAFGNYFTDSDLKDQDDLYENKQIGTSTLRRFHRSVNLRASTNYWSAGVGYRITPQLAVGFGLAYFNVDELVQEYQDSKQSGTDANGAKFWRVLGQNVVTRLQVHGIEPIIGAQYVIGTKFSLGLSIKTGIIASQNLTVDTEQRINTLDDEQAGVLEGGESRAVGLISENIKREKTDNPLGKWPTTTRIGAAWFPSTRLMLTMDVAHYSAVKAPEIEAFKKAVYEKEAVINYALGAEYYIMPAFPLRFGLFTNNDARDKVDEGPYDKDAGKTCADASFREKYCAQPDNIDYLGESLFIAWVQPNSQVSVGVVLQQGKGKAQKTGNHEIQDVEASAQTYAFSAVHSF